MKSTLLTFCLVAMTAAAPAFAETGAGHSHGTNTAQQPQQHQHMTDGHSMEHGDGHSMGHHETTSDLPGLIGRMNETLMSMTHAIPETRGSATEQANMKEMGAVMHEMASVLNDLAAHMDQGRMDKQALNAMHLRIKAIQQKIDGPGPQK